jgi:hypothetical protein
MELCGFYSPGGAEIRISVWCISHNEAVYGPDAAVSQPERWLKSKEKAQYFDKVDTVFRAGYNACIVKNPTLLEVHNMLVEILHNF